MRRRPDTAAGTAAPAEVSSEIDRLRTPNDDIPIAAGSPSGSRAVIALDRVVKRFGASTAVQETSLEIGEGEFFSILGPSGCGKTTTLRMIAGFERPTSGAVRLDGEDVSDVPPYRRNVNTVFQQYALFPHLSVFDNVAFGLRSTRVPRAEIATRVRELLDVVRLPQLADRRPAQLSGGQQQRVALARALVNRPRALLLDEPLGALDLKLRETMQLELKRIQRELGSTFVYVTHDQGEALTMSDRIAVMHEGRVAQIGTPPEIWFRPADVFVAGFIGTANLLPARVAGVGGGRVTVDVRGVGRTSVPNGPVPATAGQHVTFMVRPEQLLVGPEEPAGAGGTAAAVVTALTFFGPVLRATLRTAGDVDLLADIAATRGQAPPRVGDRVWVSWADGSATVVPGLERGAESGADIDPGDDRPAPLTLASRSDPTRRSP